MECGAVIFMGFYLVVATVLTVAILFSLGRIRDGK